MNYSLWSAILLFPFMLKAQKEIYIPNEWQQPYGLEYSFDRSAESGNFIIFWGPLAGTDPTQAPTDISFDPQFILNTAEELYRFYVDTIRFVNDDEGLLHQYKIILVMLHTWPGIEGWAFGGNYDGKVGAMWMHPHAASSGPTLAHEFTHTLQNYAWMLNPGHGFIDSSYVGFFWETHAEFMALQKYPSVALQFDMARWLNTCQFQWSSTRHHYQAFVFLQYIKEKDGIGMINRMWNESNIGEHPLQTYMRLKGIDQETLNDYFGEYAMRNVTWDYQIGDLLRERESTLESKFISHPTFIPELIDSAKALYRIPNHLSPQDYGYNIIRLYPKETPGCEKRMVQLHFTGQTISPGYEEAGWRLGLVAVNDQLQPRYSPQYADDAEIVFELNADETELYLVVTGAPQNHHNYQWEIGFPRVYRFPYDFRIQNAWPEGYQPEYRKPDSAISGAPHSNGGGFVASSAFADATAYVGPNAQVLDQARIIGYARVDDYAIVKNNALIEGNASISGKAIIGEDAHVYGNAHIADEAKVMGGCAIYDSAIVKGNSLIFFTAAYEKALLKDNTFCWGANLHGDIILGGDAEFFSECSDGTYLQFEGAYNRNCDGLDDHPANENLSDVYWPWRIQNQFKLLCDTFVENYYEYQGVRICEGDTLYFNGIPLTEEGTYEDIYEASNGGDSIFVLDLDYFSYVTACMIGKICPGDTIWFGSYPITEPGPYQLFLDTIGCGLILDVLLKQIYIDTTVTLVGNTLWAAQQSLEPDMFVCEYDTIFQPNLGAIYQWFDCETDLPIPGAIQRSFTPTQNGTYKVRYTTIEECEAYSSCYTITTVSVSGPIPSFQWHIQPNPADEYVQIVLNELPSSDLLIEVYDMIGRRQSRKLFSKINTTEKIDLEKYPPGSYVIKLTGPKGSSTSKIFKKI